MQEPYKCFPHFINEETEALTCHIADKPEAKNNPDLSATCYAHVPNCQTIRCRFAQLQDRGYSEGKDLKELEFRTPKFKLHDLEQRCLTSLRLNFPSCKMGTMKKSYLKIFVWIKWNSACEYTL